MLPFYALKFVSVGCRAILGNEKANQLAVTAKSQSVEHDGIPFQDHRRPLKRAIFNKWQSDWDQCSSNKLLLVHLVLKEWKNHCHRECFYDVIMCRLCIGHTPLSYGFFMQAGEPPLCHQCSEILGVIHILIECSTYLAQQHILFTIFFRQHILFHSTLLLGSEPLVPADNVIEFLKAVGIVHWL